MSIQTASMRANGANRPDRASNISSPVMSVLAGCMGLVQTISYDQHWLLWPSMVTLTIIGFWGMVRLLFVPSFVTAWSVFGVSLALAYGFGALNTLSSDYVDGSSMYLINFAGRDALGRAEGAILLIVGVLLYIGHKDPYKTIPLQAFTEAERRVSLLIAATICLGTLAALATGQLGFQGVQTGSEDSYLVSPLASLVSSCLTPASGLAILAYGARPNSRARWAVILLCVILAMTQMTQGRRLFAFNALAALMAFFAVRDAKSFFSAKTIIILLIFLAAIAGASRFFVSMRIAGYSLPPDASMSERLTGAWDVLTHPDREGLDEHIDQSQSTRTFIVGYVGELIQAYDKTGRTTSGDLLKLNIAGAVPTAIWPGKWRIIAEIGSDEVACHAKMGMTSWDAANTVVTEGLCDFGWTGMFTYPIAVAGLMTLANLAIRRTSVVIRALVAFATIKSMLGVEGGLISYIVELRNTAILAIAAAVLIGLFNWYMKLPSVSHRRKQKALHERRGAS